METAIVDTSSFSSVPISVSAISWAFTTQGILRLERLPVINARYSPFVPSIGAYIIGSDMPDPAFISNRVITPASAKTAQSGLTLNTRHITTGTERISRTPMIFHNLPMRCHF